MLLALPSLSFFDVTQSSSHAFLVPFGCVSLNAKVFFFFMLFLSHPYSLRKYFNQANKMKYLQSLVQIPTLGPDPPSFLLPGQLIALELAKQVRLVSQPVEEASISSLVDLDTTTETTVTERPHADSVSSQTSVHDAQFGTTGFNESFDFARSRSPVKEKDERFVLLLRSRRGSIESGRSRGVAQ